MLFNTHQIQLSIVVAAYNVEDYIRDTIMDILQQMKENCELLIINDGSNDNTKTIINDYMQTPRVVVINQSNKGVSNVRNTGINMAKGKFIWFVDGDDRINEGSIDNILQITSKNEDVDVVISNYLIDYKDQTSLQRQFLQEHSEVEIIESRDLLINKLWNDQSDFGWSVWSNVYNLSFLKQKKIFFNEDLFYNEDGDWILTVLTSIDRVILNDYAIYRYNKRNSSSITAGKRTLEKYKCSHYTLTKWYRVFEKNGNDVLMHYFGNYYMSAAVTLYEINDKKDRREAIDLFSNDVDILSHANNAYAKLYNSLHPLPASVKLWLIYIVHRFAKVRKLK